MTPRLLAFAQLLRLPNVFTAVADTALAGCVGAAVYAGWESAAYLSTLALLATASAGLYLAGMVWNDVFDLAEDTRDRPFRPLPSGRIAVRTAGLLAGALTLVGVGLTFVAGSPLLGVALGGCVLLYDAGLKRTPLGPVAMAACRFLNVLLGLSAIPADAFPLALRLHTAGVVGVYIVGVTWFARTEATESSRRHLTAAACVIAVSLAMALVLRGRVPVEPGPSALLFPYLLVAFGFVVGVPLRRAIRRPGPKEVQAAIKRCVLGLVGLDAVLAVAFVGLPGLGILLLLPPAVLLGKWVYST